MTDAAPQPEQLPPAEPATPSQTGPAQAAPAAAGARGSRLALPALLLAAGALLLGGWNLNQLQQPPQADPQLQALLQALDARITQQGQRIEQGEHKQQARLSELPSAELFGNQQRLLADLQAGQQTLAARIEQVLGASRQEWRLAEAEYLLRLAALRLSALQDVSSAQALVQASDQILRDHDDPAAFAARQQLARSLEALRRLPVIDRTGLFLQLAALSEQASGLDTRLPVFNPSQAAASTPAAEGMAAWWQRLSGFVRLEFTASDQVKPRLAGQTREQLRLALRLALEQAQWAALHADAAVYGRALEQARLLVQEFFGLDDAHNQALFERLGTLAAEPVAVELPDLSPALNALQAYLEQRARAALAQQVLTDEPKASGAAQDTATPVTPPVVEENAAPADAPVQAPTAAAGEAEEVQP